MKLAGAGAAAFCSRPDRATIAALLHGPDSGLIALRRRELVDALIEGDDLRLTRMEPSAALKDPSEIDAALRVQGFFPGRRVVLIDGAKDSLAKALKDVLGEIRAEDAFLVVTAENLARRSALRRLFEDGVGLVALGLYPEPPGATELADLLRAAGLTCGLTSDAAEDLAAVSQMLDRGALLQLIEKISVFALDWDRPLDQETMVQLLPSAGDIALDRLVTVVAEGRPESVVPLIGRLSAAGVSAAGMLIATGRHFHQLLSLSNTRNDFEAALGRLRPPAFGARRRALTTQTRRWGPARLETANRLLFQADRTMRSSGDRPDRALVERCLMRLAMMVARD